MALNNIPTRSVPQLNTPTLTLSKMFVQGRTARRLAQRSRANVIIDSAKIKTRFPMRQGRAISKADSATQIRRAGDTAMWRPFGREAFGIRTAGQTSRPELSLEQSVRICTLYAHIGY